MMNGFVPTLQGLPLRFVSSGDYLLHCFILNGEKTMSYMEIYGTLINI
jgi:hypothetical protein